MSIAPATVTPDILSHFDLSQNVNDLSHFDRKVSSIRTHTYYKPFTISLVTVEEIIAALTTPLSDRKVQEHLKVSTSLASALKEQVYIHECTYMPLYICLYTDIYMYIYI
jgi:hypothetical protein